MGMKDTEYSRRVGEGGGEYRRLSEACAVAIFREEKGILVGGIKVGRYGKLTPAALYIAFSLNVSLTSVTHQVENI